MRCYLKKNLMIKKNLKKIFVKSYGCQMNIYDSNRIKDLFEPKGYIETSSFEDADLIVLNTCHIREKAAEKIYSELGRIAPHKINLKSQGKKLNIVLNKVK